MNEILFLFPDPAKVLSNNLNLKLFLIVIVSMSL